MSAEHGPHPDDVDYFPTYEAVLASGDRAESDSIAGILIAASTLARDAAAAYGGLKRAREHLVITEDGEYDAGLTSLARDGYVPSGGAR